MKIYGKTDDIIVREMTKKDIKPFFKYIKEMGNKEGLDIDEVKMIWEFRNKKGDVQCVVTSADSSATIYGFCGLLHTNPKMVGISIGFFKEYDSIYLRRQARRIMRIISLKKVVSDMNE